MAGGDLHVPQADAGVGHGGDEYGAACVVHPRHAVPGGGCDVLDLAGSGVPVHPGADRVAEDRAVLSPVDGSVDRAAGSGWRRDEHDLAAFAAYP